MCGGGGYVGTLYFLLNIAVNLKTLFKRGKNLLLFTLKHVFITSIDLALEKHRCGVSICHNLGKLISLSQFSYL